MEWDGQRSHSCKGYSSGERAQLRQNHIGGCNQQNGVPAQERREESKQSRHPPAIICRVERG